MQTFLPYPDFVASATCLDNRRLNKQILEVSQILNAITKGPYQQKTALAGYISCSEETFKQLPRHLKRKTPWYNHPATQMWKDTPNALCVYGLRCCIEARKRNIKCDTVFQRISAHYDDHQLTLLPSWLGDEAFHNSHKATLLRKSPKWYGQFGWTGFDKTMEVIWPTKQTTKKD